MLESRGGVAVEVYLCEVRQAVRPPYNVHLFGLVCEAHRLLCHSARQGPSRTCNKNNEEEEEHILHYENTYFIKKDGANVRGSGVSS